MEEIKNYCAVFLGDLEGVHMDIENVSMGVKTGLAESETVLIATFQSSLSTDDLIDFFGASEKELAERNFFIMEVETSAIHFGSQMIDERLMGIFPDNIRPKAHLPIELELDIDNMSEDEIQNKIDEILDKPNMTSKDRQILNLLNSIQ